MDFFNGLCGLLQHIAWTSDSGILNNVVLNETEDKLIEIKLQTEVQKEGIK